MSGNDALLALLSNLRGSNLPTTTAAADEIVRMRLALENVRLSAARGRVFGHGPTPQTLERTIEKKDKALEEVIRWCGEAGVVGSVLRKDGVQ